MVYNKICSREYTNNVYTVHLGHILRFVNKDTMLDNRLFEAQKIILSLFWHPSALETDISIRGASRMTKYPLYPYLRDTTCRQIGGAATTCRMRRYKVAFSSSYILPSLKTSCFCRDAGFLG